jgi:membrane fusion protein (multidrug efflux system)
MNSRSAFLLQLLLSSVLILSVSIILRAEEDQPGTSLAFDATLVVENDVDIKTRLTGIIQEIYVERGSSVKKGAPLARLENADLALEVQKAEVSMKQAQAEYSRAKSLYDEKLLSDSDFEQRKLSFEKGTSEYELAKVNYEKSIIKAPFAGVVTERNVKIGQRVVEDDNVTLFRITAMEPLLARIFVPEEQLKQIEKGQSVDFVPAYAATRHFPGRVKWISSIIDPGSGTASVLIELLPVQQRGVIKPGTSGKVTFRTSTIAKQKPAK